MSNNIDSKSIVHPNAVVGENVFIGPNTIVEDNVVIGAGTRIASNALIANGSRIGINCKIHHGAVIGTIPQDLKFKDEPSIAEIGDNTVIREYVTVNRGTAESGKTTIGKNCFIMAYVHVAHDCVLGNNVILANSVNMAGHVHIGDFVVIGGLVPIHQFCHIGSHSMIGGGYRVSKDVPPYVLAGSDPLSYQGLNIVGLRRRHFLNETIENIEKVYSYIYSSHLNVSQALQKIQNEVVLSEETKHIIDFIKQSSRGIIGSRR